MTFKRLTSREYLVTGHAIAVNIRHLGEGIEWEWELEFLIST
jgi:hypothetical protein